ncbi:MAG: hypothetical protein LUQ31_04690 [Methanoregula sp.]|nr:hypothetical protein [Methanoregula sp.]
MRVSSASAVLIVSAVCISLIFVPVAATYTISDLSGGSALVRGHQFTVDITGRPNTAYYAWLTRTWSLSGEPGDQPPVVVANQWNVQQDPADGPYTIGTYQYYNGNGRTILDDVAPTSSVMPATSYYALVTTDESGQAVLAFQTSANTALRSYSVRVENPTSVNNDTLLVQRGDTKVSKGSISIEAIATRPTKPPVAQITTELTLPETPPPEPVLTTPVPPTTSVPETTKTHKASFECGFILIALGAALCAARAR